MASSNQDYANKIKKHLNKSYKMMFEKATQQTFYHVILETWQDSSRAASNWQVLGAGDSPAPFIDARNTGDVGKRGEKRSEQGRHTSMEVVALGRLVKYGKKINSGVWANKSTEFWLYNSLDNYNSDEADIYWERAGIERVEGSAKVVSAFEAAANMAFQKWQIMGVEK